MRVRLGIAPLLFLAAGCTERGGPAPGADAIAFDTVVMHRSACFGFCPVYTVSISSDGVVTFEGESYVAAVGKRAAHVKASEISLLRQAFANVRFFELQEQYRYEPDGCTEWRTDNPTVDIVVIAGERRHHISYYYGCEIEVGKHIDSLSKIIDDIADTKKWIGPSAL